MLAIFQYIQERFPVVSAFFFAIGYAALTIGCALLNNPWLHNFKNIFPTLILITMVFFFFLLRQRTVDEFRDTEHDIKNFPDRPLPRGLITKEQLAFLGIVALSVELISVYFLGNINIYIFVLLYSLLMAKEFFISTWLNRHFTLYFLVHEVIFILFGAYFISVININFLSLDVRFVLLLSILVFAPVSIEIIRKFSPRYNKEGQAVIDTYSTVWGRTNAVMILIGLSLYLGITLTFLKSSYYFIIFSSINIFAWVLLAKKSDKFIKAIGIINFLGFALLANLIW